MTQHVEALPENEKGITRDQRIDIDADGRSKARELAAKLAYEFVVHNGLWINLKDAHVVPCLDESINQLQELYQKNIWKNRRHTRLKKRSGISGNVTAYAGESMVRVAQGVKQQQRRRLPLWL